MEGAVKRGGVVVGDFLRANPAVSAALKKGAFSAAHILLSGVGLVPGAEGADALDAELSLAEGDNVGACMSAAACVPIGGMVAGVGKIVRGGSNMVEATGDLLAAAKAAASGGLPGVAKTVNSNMPHAIERAVERGIFPNAAEARTGLESLSARIGKEGFPEGAILDTAHADRVLVPLGEGGMAVYQVGANGTAKLKTILNAL